MDGLDWEQLNNSYRNALVFNHRNKKYGAYLLRMNYPKRMFFSILIVIFGVFVIGTLMLLPLNGSKGQQIIQKEDTLLLSLSTPPQDPLQEMAEVIAQSGDDTETFNEEKEKKEPQKDAVIEPPVSQGEIQSDLNSARSKNPIQNSPTYGKEKGRSLQEQIEEENRKMMNSSDEAMRRAKIRKEMDERKAQREQMASKGQNSAQNTTKNTGQKGENLVNWKLKNRTPFNDDPRQIPIPGYKCGRGVSGTITMRIKVNGEGKVIDAELIGEESEVNPCILDEAKRYALKSRFNSVPTPMQEGTIEYRFVAQ